MFYRSWRGLIGGLQGVEGADWWCTGGGGGIIGGLQRVERTDRWFTGGGGG